MQIVGFTSYYPLLLESDALSLSSRFELSSLTLLDRTLGAQHILLPQAYEIVNTLSAGVQLKDLEERAESLHVSPGQLDETIGFLNFVGALTLRRSPLKILHVLHMRIHGYVLYIRYGTLSRRNDATLTRTALGLLLATWPVIVSSPIAIVLVCMSGFIDAGQLILATALWVTTFLASFYLHELAHIMVVRQAGVKCDTFQRGMRFGILHKPLPARTEIISSLAGPAAGIGFCGLAGLAEYTIGNHVCAYMSVVIAAFHICSLLPWYGDGKSLYKSLKQLKVTI